MWLKNRFKRFRLKWHNLNTYFKSLSKANRIERMTNLADCKNLVLLLYGFGATRRSVSILESRLRNDGFDVISLKLGGFLDLFNTAPIDHLAQHVAQKIERLCERYQIPRFSIIGYSKGGLIGRYYLTHLGGEKRVHTLITLATPHQGSPWSLLSSLFVVGLISKGVRQMIPRSRFIKELSAKGFPSNVYAVSIYSSRDKTCPAKYSKLPKTDDEKNIQNILMPTLNHSDFVIKPSAYKTIHNHLLEGIKLATISAEKSKRLET